MTTSVAEVSRIMPSDGQPACQGWNRVNSLIIQGADVGTRRPKVSADTCGHPLLEVESLAAHGGDGLLLDHFGFELPLPHCFDRRVLEGALRLGLDHDDFTNRAVLADQEFHLHEALALDRLRID